MDARLIIENLLKEPYGCPMCDSGKLRNPNKEHWDDCPYLQAEKFLLNKVEQPEQVFTVTVEPQQPIQPVPELLLELDGVIIKHLPSPETYGGVAVWTLIGNYAITKTDQERAAKLIGHKVRVKEVPHCYKTVEILWKESKPPLNTEIPTD